MLISIISLVSGFILLIWSADAFTDNGAKIANIFKISPLIIGILIFGFGTSAPEMLVSGLAAFEGHPELSVGNAFGSNILNIALVLGVSAMIMPRKIWEMNQLQVAQSDGIVRKTDGTVVGKQKWIVNVDYSLDTKEGEDFIVNAVSAEEAEDKVQKLIEGIARRKDMQAGMVFVNFATPSEEFNG